MGQIVKLFRHEQASGLLMIAAIVLALTSANSPFVPIYAIVHHTPVHFRLGPLIIDKPLVNWINVGLMVIIWEMSVESIRTIKMKIKQPCNNFAHTALSGVALTRRHLLCGLATLPVADWATDAEAEARRNYNLAPHETEPAATVRRTIKPGNSSEPGPAEAGRVDTPPGIYAALPDEQFSVPAVARGVLPKQFWRQVVDDPTGEKPGTVVVDTPAHYLYLVLPEGRAMRYGVGVGKAGFEWQGRASIAWKRKWPTWTPPASMIRREPHLEKYREGMEPGLENPLGARALYIHENGVDTLYRIHGTNQPDSIGKSLSSGCIRMINQDVIDLFDRVHPPASIVVLQGDSTLFS